MKRKTYVVSYTVRNSESGYLYKFGGSTDLHAWNSALRFVADVMRAQFAERGTRFTESYKSFQRDAFRFVSGKIGLENAYNVRIDFEILLIQE